MSTELETTGTGIVDNTMSNARLVEAAIDRLLGNIPHTYASQERTSLKTVRGDVVDLCTFGIDGVGCVLIRPYLTGLDKGEAHALEVKEQKVLLWIRHRDLEAMRGRNILPEETFISIYKHFEKQLFPNGRECTSILV